VRDIGVTDELFDPVLFCQDDRRRDDRRRLNEGLAE
jgi:hypothetical protein